MIFLLAWVRVPGLVIPMKANALLTNLKQEQYLSTEWLNPTRVYPLAESSDRVMAEN